MSIFSERFRRISSPQRREAPRPHYERQTETEGFPLPRKEPDSELKGMVSELKDNALKNGEVLKNLSDKVEGFEDVKTLLEAGKKETIEAMHTENVKVYRNVQAVVVDEAGKIKESVDKSADNTEAKVNTAVVFSVMAFVVAVLHFVFDILDNLGIF